MRQEGTNAIQRGHDYSGRPLAEARSIPKPCSMVYLEWSSIGRLLREPTSPLSNAQFASRFPASASHRGGHRQRPWALARGRTGANSSESTHSDDDRTRSPIRKIEANLLPEPRRVCSVRPM